MIQASVVVPAYNAEAYVGRALASALAQTEPDIEVLVVDDASTDRTAEIVAAIAAADPRVRLLRAPVNAGPGAARNRGLAAARGTWIALLDADDAFAPERIATLCALGARHGADLVADNLLLCGADSDGTPMLPPHLLAAPRRVTAAEFVLGNIGSPRTPRISYGFMHPLLRREFLAAHGLRYEERNRFGEDFLLYLACLACGACWWITPTPLYHYTVRAGSLTEVQTAADLLRIRTAEQRLMDDAATDPQFRQALRRHQAGIDRRYHYRAFTDALKGRTPARALGLLCASRSSLRHIALESAAQLPVILRKALRGGYRRGTPAASRDTDRLPAAQPPNGNVGPRTIAAGKNGADRTGS
jgi:hypothetical protein